MTVDFFLLDLFICNLFRSIFLPYKLTPDLVEFTSFQDGSTSFQVTIYLATGKNKSRRVSKPRIESVLSNLRGTHVHCILRFSTAWFKPYQQLCTVDTNIDELYDKFNEKKNWERMCQTFFSCKILNFPCKNTIKFLLTRIFPFCKINIKIHLHRLPVSLINIYTHWSIQQYISYLCLAVAPHKFPSVAYTLAEGVQDIGSCPHLVDSSSAWNDPICVHFQLSLIVAQPQSKSWHTMLSLHRKWNVSRCLELCTTGRVHNIYTPICTTLGERIKNHRVYLIKCHSVYYLCIKIGAATLQNWPPLDAGKQYWKVVIVTLSIAPFKCGDY